MDDLQIEPILKGSESRRKVITILKGIWLDIDDELIDLRDRALDMMPTLSREESKTSKGQPYKTPSR